MKVIDFFLMVCEQTFLFYPVVLSLYISYRLLKLTDLSADGVYVLGGAVFAKTLPFAGPLGATCIAGFFGILLGWIVALMQRGNHIRDLIVGILVTFMLYSVNFEVLGRPNYSLLGKLTLLKAGYFSQWIIGLAFINIILVAIVYLLCRSRYGLLMRAFGHNYDLLIKMGFPAERYRIIGLSMGSFLTAVTGALFAQINGFVDLNMGSGVALIAIGALMIGHHIFRTKNEVYHPGFDLLSAFIGIFTYFAILAFLMKFGVQPVHLKFFIGLILFASLRSSKGYSLGVVS
ncbi:MAG: ABC transporter permease [Gammaproteobacteria bacterium]|nr:ABC transporter permease [Gammaproteobacteria bacterium]